VSDPAAARDLELLVHHDLCFVNPSVVSLARHARALGCRTAIVSDTSFCSTELLRLLEEQGIEPALFDAVFASCERGKAKWLNGTLYHEALRPFDLPRGGLFHIGDDFDRDVVKPRRLGIDAHHYGRSTPALRRIFQGEQRLSSPGEPRAGSLESLRVWAHRQA